jgi:site-specific recombinase XerD
MTAKGLRADPWAFNKKAVQDYISYMERSKEVATILRHVSSLRAFSRFLQDSKIVTHEAMRGLRLPSKAAPEPRGLSDKDRARFEAVFQQPMLRPTQQKRSAAREEIVLQAALDQLARDRAMAFLMLYAGPRVEELVLLNLTDIELGERSGRLHIRKGKGNRERWTNIPLPARKALQTWLKVRGIQDGPLFTRLRGATGMRLTIRAVQEVISVAGRRARIEEPVTPHVLRHSCAFLLRQAGADIETRAKMLGHSIETASKYGAPGASEIEKAAALLDHAEAA